MKKTPTKKETKQEKKPQKRQVYTEEFKKGAVALVQKGERTAGQVAQHLEISRKTLNRWIKEAAAEAAAQAAAKEEIARKKYERQVLAIKRAKRIMVAVFVIIVLLGVFRLIKFTSMAIGDTEIKIYRNDVPALAWVDRFILKDESATGNMQRNKETLRGKIRSDVFLFTPYGSIVIPKKSDIFAERNRILSTTAITFSNDEGFRNNLEFIGHKLGRDVNSVTFTPAGILLGFSVKDNAISLVSDNITFNVLSMKINASISVNGNRLEYIVFSCNNFSPIELESNVTISLNNDIHDNFSVYIYSNNSGEYQFSGGDKMFIVEHPSLPDTIAAREVKFNVLSGKIISYKIHSNGKETVIQEEGD